MVSIDCEDEILFVPTWIITKSTELKFTLPDETKLVSLAIVAPGKACTEQPSIPLTYLGIDADNKVALFSVKTPEI